MGLKYYTQYVLSYTYVSLVSYYTLLHRFSINRYLYKYNSIHFKLIIFENYVQKPCSIFTMKIIIKTNLISE